MGSKVMRVDKEFKEYVESISKILKIKPSNVTKRIAEIRPINIQKPLGHGIDRLFGNDPFIHGRKKKRKGSVIDIPIIFVGIFIISLVLFFSYAIFDGMANADVLKDNNWSSAILDNGRLAYNVWDAGIVFIFFGLLIGSAISAYLLRSHPIFFVASLSVWVITFVIGAILSNTFALIAGSTPLLTTSSIMTNTVAVNTNYPYLVAISGAIIILALYLKRGRDENEISGY